MSHEECWGCHYLIPVEHIREIYEEEYGYFVPICVECIARHEADNE